MGSEQKKLPNVFIIILIWVLFIAVSCFKHSEKADFNMDEIVTYTFANNTGNKQWVWQEKLDNPRESLEEFFTVNDKYNPPFNYGNVWKNSQGDTHPPLYYILVHTVSSFFIGEFSKWIPFSVNVFFGCLTILAVYGLVKSLMEDETTALFCALIFAVNPALVEMVTFLRMYILGMFCCVLFAYIVIKHWKKRGNVFYLSIIAVLVLGSLSHYYFLIYAFFTCGMIVLYDIFHKDKKNVGKMILSCVAGAGIVLIVYPAILDHMFGSGDGPKNFENLFHFADYFERLQEYFSFLNQDVFHGTIALVVLTAVGGGGIAYRNREYSFLCRIGFLVIPTFCYFLVVAKVSPYLQDRYLCLIYPMVIIWVFVGVLKFIRQFTRNRLAVFNIILCGVIFLIIELSAYPHYKWDYTKKDFAIEVQSQIDKIKHYDCMAILDAEWKIWTLYPHLSQYSTITYMKTNQDFILDSKDYTQDGIVVYLLSEEDEEFLNRLLECFEQYDSYDLVFDSENIAFCNVYLLH